MTHAQRQTGKFLLSANCLSIANMKVNTGVTITGIKYKDMVYSIH